MMGPSFAFFELKRQPIGQSAHNFITETVHRDKGERIHSPMQLSTHRSGDINKQPMGMLQHKVLNNNQLVLTVSNTDRNTERPNRKHI